jgi:hypothetical protein
LFVLLGAVFAAAAFTGNWLILPLAVAVMFLFEAIAPIETVFVARYAPAARRGFFFGMRYAISIVGGPVGVWLVAALYEPGVRFTWLLAALGAGAFLTAAFALALPRDREVLAFGGAGK